MKLVKELKGIIKKPKVLFKVVLLYAATFLVAFLIGKGFSVLFLPKRELFNLTIAIISVTAYFLILLLVYSFFKIFIIGTVSNKRLTMDRLGGFFLFNIVTLVLSLIAFSLVGYFITYTFNKSLIATAAFIIAFMIFYYPFLLFSQFEFIEKNKIFRSLGAGWKNLFSNKLKGYLKILLFDVIIIGAYFLLFLLIGSLYKLIFINNNQSPAAHINFYNFVFVLFLVIVMIFIISFNIFLIKKLKD